MRIGCILILPAVLLCLALGQALAGSSVLNADDVPHELRLEGHDGLVHDLTVAPGTSVTLPGEGVLELVGAPAVSSAYTGQNIVISQGRLLVEGQSKTKLDESLYNPAPTATAAAPVGPASYTEATKKLREEDIYNCKQACRETYADCFDNCLGDEDCTSQCQMQKVRCMNACGVL